MDCEGPCAPASTRCLVCYRQHLRTLRYQAHRQDGRAAAEAFRAAEPPLSPRHVRDVERALRRCPGTISELAVRARVSYYGASGAQDALARLVGEGCAVRVGEVYRYVPPASRAPESALLALLPAGPARVAHHLGIGTTAVAGRMRPLVLAGRVERVAMTGCGVLYQRPLSRPPQPPAAPPRRGRPPGSRRRAIVDTIAAEGALAREDLATALGIEPGSLDRTLPRMCADGELTFTAGGLYALGARSGVAA